MIASSPRLRAPLALVIVGVLAACGDDQQTRTDFVDTAPVVTTRELVEVAVDLLEPGAFELRSENPAAPVSPGPLSPSGLPSEAGGDRPSLRMAPPAELAFQVPEGAEGVRYRFDTAFGLDQSARERGKGQRVAFEVLVDGQPVAEVFAGWRPGMRPEDCAWVGFGDQHPDGLEVPAGSELRVRSRVDIWDGLGDAPPLPAGLALPRLVRLEPVEVRAATPERPNIVFILMDTLRQDRLGCYGYEAARTPNIDGLAARGLVYEEAHASSSWTWPSTASMLTGLLPEEHGVVDTSSCYLASSFETLPEVLRRAGYATAGFSGNPLISPRRNFQQGFDHFLTDPANFRFSSDIMPPALEWLDEHHDERFFLFLQLVDTHDPYTPMERFGGQLLDEAPEGYPYTAVIDYGGKLRQRFAEDPDWSQWASETMSPAAQAHMSKLYDACVQSADHWVGEVLARLEAHGIDENTLIVFTSDHGEEFLEHGLVGHGQSLHAELTRVPLILAGPNVAPARVDRLVANRDLGPTLARLVGGELPAARDGQDLLDPDGLTDRAVFLSSHHGVRNGGQTPLFGVRKQGWLYSLAPDATAPHASRQLFDLANDPSELNNLAEENRAMLEQLERLVQKRLERSASVAPATGFEAGEATLEFFNKIGYGGE